MITDFYHSHIPCDLTHREDEVEASRARIVEAAYACGVHKAFLNTHRQVQPDVTAETVHRTFMNWFYLTNYVLRPNKASISAKALESLDLRPLEAAIEAYKKLKNKVQLDRGTVRTTDFADEERRFLMDLDASGVQHLTGATKVVFPDGSPRPVFHATRITDFERFKPLSHFGSAATASRFARGLKLEPDETMRIFQVWLDIRNPLRLDDGGTQSSLWLVRQALKTCVISGAEAFMVSGVRNLGDPENEERDPDFGHDMALTEQLFAALLMSKGYDGIVYRNTVEGGGDSWIAMSPDQVIHGQDWTYRCIDYHAGHRTYEELEEALAPLP